MKCPLCGAENNEGAGFCTSCGQAITTASNNTSSNQGFNPFGNPPQSAGQSQLPPEYSQFQPQSGPILAPKSNRKKTVLITVLVVIVLAIAYGFFINTDVNKIRRAHPELYPDKTFGKTFKAYFDDGDWSSKKIDGEKYVIFTGECKKYGEVEIRFMFPETNKFTVAYISLDGVVQKNYMLKWISMQADIFGD